MVWLDIMVEIALVVSKGCITLHMHSAMQANKIEANVCGLVAVRASVRTAAYSQGDVTVP